MSLIDKNQNASQGNAARGQGGNVNSVLNLGSMFTSRVSRSAAGESLTGYVEAMREILKKDNVAEGTFQLIPVDSTMSSLVCGTIALVMRKNDRAAVYTFVVESTIQGQLMDRSYKQHGGPDITIPTVAGDIYNFSSVVFEKVRAVCENHVNGVTVWEQAGGDVLPVELKADDEVRIRNVLHRATNAVETLIEDNPALNLAALAPTTNFAARISFDNDQAETAAGLPIRRSFRIDLNGSDKSAASQSMIQQNVVNLSTVAGYVDILFTDSVMVPQPYGAAIPSSQKFQPKLIITDSAPGCNLITPELQLLSLASVTQLIRGSASWLTALKPRFTEDGVSMHSLNGLRAELGDDFDVNDPSFDLYAFANMFFHPIAIELHVPECSDTTWILSMLRDAAKANPAAQQAVVAAANNLTNNSFGKYFKGGIVAAHVEDRVVLGYYYDKAGKMRDLRDIDYLAVLNLLGETDKPLAFEFADTYNPAKGTLEQRLSRRIEIIKTVLGGNVKIKGYATPILLSPDFLKALYDGITECGVNMNIEGYLEQYRAQTRGNTVAMDFGVRPDAFGNAYSGYGVGASNFAPTFQGRSW